MALLAELNVTKIGTWKDRAGEVVWKDTTDVVWTSSNVLYVSLEGFVGDHYWDEYIATLTPPQYTMSREYGGYVRMSFGSLSISPDAFQASLWPPPVSFLITFYYTATTEGAKETLFSGIAHIAQINRESVTYDLYGEELDADLLLETTDYNGETVVLPRAFGTIQHQQPVRLADVGGEPTYHKGYVTGVVVTNWHVYDDGVNIDANVTDLGDGSFSLSASPVGEVTISGIGADGTTLSTIVSWACGPAWLNQNYDSSLARAPSPDINFWASSQRVLIEFISDLCAVHTHLSYINSNTQTLYLVDLATDNGTRTLTEFDFFSAQYCYEPPIAQITAKWIKREAVEETVGKYIKDIDHETVQKSNYSYGEELELQPFHNVKADIDTALANIITNIHKPRIRVPLPLLGSLPVPGESITLTDTSLRHDTTAVFRCRNVTYSFGDDEVMVEGEGTIT